MKKKIKSYIIYSSLNYYLHKQQYAFMFERNLAEAHIVVFLVSN